METPGQAITRVDLGRYRTPLGKLARRFKASLESWKAKYQELKRQVKRYQNRAADAARSRDTWKEQARHWKACAGELQAEVDRLRAETAGPKSKQNQRS